MTIHLDGDMSEEQLGQVVDYVLGDVVSAVISASDSRGFDRVKTQSVLLTHLAGHMFRLSLGTEKAAFLDGLSAAYDVVHGAALEARAGHKVM